jgi:L-asparagine transporter-like permease
MDVWTIAAIVIAVVGAGAMFASRWLPGSSEWARAAVIAAVAVALSGAAWRGGGALELWFSGFFVCAALHRVIDAVTQSRTQQ